MATEKKSGNKHRSDEDDELNESKERDADGKGLFGEAIRRVFTAGVSAAFMTEDAIRSYLSELKLPKELLSVLIQSANKSKEEITQRVSKEVVNILQQIDVIKEASKFVENHKFKITAEIEVLKKDKNPK